MALALRKLLSSEPPCAGTATQGDLNHHGTPVLLGPNRPRWTLTGFKGHDAFQTGELCRVQAHLPEPGDHLLEGLDLRHDLVHPLGLGVLGAHPCW